MFVFFQTVSSWTPKKVALYSHNTPIIQRYGGSVKETPRHTLPTHDDHADLSPQCLRQCYAHGYVATFLWTSDPFFKKSHKKRGTQTRSRLIQCCAKILCGCTQAVPQVSTRGHESPALSSYPRQVDTLFMQMKWNLYCIYVSWGIGTYL